MEIMIGNESGTQCGNPISCACDIVLKFKMLITFVTKVVFRHSHINPAPALL